jgi:chromosome segregation ATPase
MCLSRLTITQRSPVIIAPTGEKLLSDITTIETDAEAPVEIGHLVEFFRGTFDRDEAAEVVRALRGKSDYARSTPLKFLLSSRRENISSGVRMRDSAKETLTKELLEHCSACTMAYGKKMNLLNQKVKLESERKIIKSRMAQIEREQDQLKSREELLENDSDEIARMQAAIDQELVELRRNPPAAKREVERLEEVIKDDNILLERYDIFKVAMRPF